MSGLSIAAHFSFARVKVISQSVHRECQVPGAIIQLAPDRRFRPLCHLCGGPASVHSQGLRRIVRDLDVAGAQVYLDVQYRRVNCPACNRAVVEKLSFAGVAAHLELDPKTVKAIDKHLLEEEFADTDCEGLKVLAVDEISLCRGQRGYMSVVLDYQSGRVVWMGQGRKAESLDAFFATMSQQQKGAIEAVAMDMWEAYVRSVRQNCPQAKIVFDLFHVVKAYGAAATCC